MSNCNNCMVDCREEMFSKVGTNCSAWVPPEKFNTPLIKHLMSDDKKANKCVEVLNAFGFIIKETPKYPGFKLEPKK